MNEEKSDQQLTDEIADYFSNISAHFPPINFELIDCPPPLSDFVSDVNCYPNEHEIHMILNQTKKTCSVPNDIPLKIVREFLPELTKPITMIYYKSIGEGMYPTSWKVEFMSPVPKIFPPEEYSDLRNISLTEWISKAYDFFLLNGTATVKGLLYYVRK